MSDALTLPDDLIAELAPLPRHVQAIRLLTEVGPAVDAGAGFDGPTAGLAYLMFLAWLRTPLRDGKPGYEGWQIVQRRARKARTAPTLHDYGHALLRGLRAHMPDLSDEDAVWWRSFCDAYGSEWRRLRRPEAIEDALVAAGLLRGWLFDLKTPAPARAPRTSILPEEV